MEGTDVANVSFQSNIQHTDIEQIDILVDIGLNTQNIKYSPELVEFIKYDHFLIFWCIFCRNPWKMEYENEVCFEACRVPNFF